MNTATISGKILGDVYRSERGPARFRVSAPYVDDDGKTRSPPVTVVAWGAAGAEAARFSKGDEVYVTGRIQADKRKGKDGADDTWEQVLGAVSVTAASAAEAPAPARGRDDDSIPF